MYILALVNKNTCPGDKSALRPGGLRLGSPALTSRGMKEKEFEKVADFIDKAVKMGLEILKVCDPKVKGHFNKQLHSDDFKGRVEALKKEVEEFAAAYPMPGNEIY